MTETPAGALLSCRNLWKVFGPRPGWYFDTAGYRIDPEALAERLRREGHIPAVADASFDVQAGEIFVIMGLSGSGKSTLVRCLSRLLDVEHGSMSFEGVDLRAVSGRELTEIRRRKMGMVFQSFGLLPHLTALENVAFPLKLRGMARAAREARAQEMLELVELGGRAGALPSELSGGQQQRIGIARSLAPDPDLWFLDEPFSALDPLIRRQMQDEFLRLQRQLKKTIVFITHDIMEACRLADRIALMRGGRIIQIGTPAEILLSPADSYVAEFTADVALSRAIRLGDLAVTAVPGEAPAGPALNPRAPIETLLPEIAAGQKRFAVEAAPGQPALVLEAEAVLAVLRRDAGPDAGCESGPR
ncbi:ATP-binding cassette domain-containing protein [Pseudogemmobacter humi]|uniref:Trimethylamine N-oxide transport system ATP-binding protein TmoW n=1 Tax=Pseudogemmobacter humi TaxID=2483812 RepID=A0A3P5WUZ2_9RHOB|nr:ATP-binding cassette domain-containing protein [Pseudogemmobacter humi]VDC25182.1 Glycine betaine/L-proline transport ATP-binding protein ProV [Pseudogemmobacter humi]